MVSSSPDFVAHRAGTARARLSPGKLVSLATALCLERGERMTKSRRRVLELLWRAKRPLTAYELIEVMSADTGRPVGPPTVYRALEFLAAQGLISKIQSRNAYAPRLHPERPSTSMFYVCEDCGESSELEDPYIERLLSKNAGALSFTMTRPIIEIEGKCANCIADEKT